MFRSYLSAKSVAWSRLNVVGVSRPFFLPREVISLTVSEEFHSVLKTLRFWCRSHCSRRWSWVDFPEPSTPSTAMSLPAAGSQALVGHVLFLVLRPGRRAAMPATPRPAVASALCLVHHRRSSLQLHGGQLPLLDNRVVDVHLEVFSDGGDGAGQELLRVDAADGDLHLDAASPELARAR